MTGLEEMKAAIEEESRLECAEIGRRAQEQAATIREEAQAAAAARYQEIVLDARRECAGELQRAKTEGEMEVKRLLLRTKTELIDETIAMALRRLRELPDGDYFNVLQTLALSYARKGEGELLALPAGSAKIARRFCRYAEWNAEKPGAQVHIGAQYAKIADGFLLAYGDIEVNCSFEALLEASLEQVKDALSRELFA